MMQTPTPSSVSDQSLEAACFAVRSAEDWLVFCVTYRDERAVEAAREFLARKRAELKKLLAVLVVH